MNAIAAAAVPVVVALGLLVIVPLGLALVDDPAVLVATMLLALWWAVGEAFDVPHPSLSWMVLTHGVANAFGFGLCALLALRSAQAWADEERVAWTPR